MEVKRGEIYYIEKNPTVYAVGREQYSDRPAIIISCNEVDKALGLAQVVYLTTQPKQDATSHVVIRSQERNSVALCEQIFTVSLNRVRNYMGKITDAEQKAIDAALMAQLGIGVPAPEHDTAEGIAEIRAEIKALSEMVSGLLPDKERTTVEAPKNEHPERHNRTTVYSELGKRMADYIRAQYVDCRIRKQGWSQQQNHIRRQMLDI